MYKVLVVEDDQNLREQLKIFLENNGYLVDVLSSFDNTADDIFNASVDIVLLDINLPNLNGEAVLKQVRMLSSVPIIMVTSRNSDIDEIISINYGADDFIVKPYNTQVLLARMDRLLKRTSDNRSLIKYRELYLDTLKSSIINGDEIIDLSKNEFKIFYYLLKNKGIIVSRDDLMNYLWDTNEFIDDNTLTVNINRLRKKLEDIGYSNAIVTRRGQGYILL